MKMHHTPYHRVQVDLIVVAFLLTLSPAYGQSTGAAAVFEGRPSMAGAQGGQGAQAGPAQGGIGAQGSQSAERSLRLRKPSGLEDMPQGRRDDSANVKGAATPAPATDVASRQEVLPGRDHGLAKEQRSAVKKTKRAAKRAISRAHHGVAEIDSSAGAANR